MLISNIACDWGKFIGIFFVVVVLFFVFRFRFSHKYLHNGVIIEARANNAMCRHKSAG